jgi:GT2 family glycosyltransferase
MNEPRLSICIVNWNTRDLLKDCLQSIYADSESEQWEVIVVDNASVDDSVEMVRVSFPLVRLFACEENKGFVGGNNLALQEARGRYWLLLNSDTQVECGSLGILLDFMDATPEAGVIGPKLLNADRSLQLSCGIVPTFYSEMANKLLLHKLFPFFKLGGWDHAQIREVGWVTGACLLVRRTAADQVGLLDPAI